MERHSEHSGGQPPNARLYLGLFVDSWVHREKTIHFQSRMILSCEENYLTTVSCQVSSKRFDLLQVFHGPTEGNCNSETSTQLHLHKCRALGFLAKFEALLQTGKVMG